MRLSFIKSRSKSLVSWELKILLIFFSSIFIILIATFSYLKVKIYVFEKGSIEARDIEVALKNNTEKIQKRIAFIQIQSNRAKMIYTDNQLLNNSIKNLLDIIPDEITLSKAILAKNGLTLYGKTPTKEIYKFRLLAPLRSIFDQTHTTYYQKSSGWINFVSKSFINGSKKVIKSEKN